MKVEIRNYKTIKHMKFEFDGFASIVGENFIGKSGIVGAILACLTNTVDKTAVRDGETFIEVDIERKGLNIHWHYEEGNTYYIVNGQEYKKLNGAVPPPIIDAGYGPITVADEKVYLWFIEQFYPMFVMDRDRSNFATDLLASIFKFDAVYKALDLCRKELRDSNSAVKAANLSLLSANDKLSPALPLETVLPSVQELVSKAAELEKLSHDVEQIDTWLAIVTDGKRAITSLAPVRSIQDVDTSGLEEAERKARLAGYLHDSLQNTMTVYSRLKSVKELPADPSTSLIEEHIKELEALSKMHEIYDGACRVLSALEQVDSIPATPSLDAYATLLEEARVVSEKSSLLDSAKKEYIRYAKVSSIPIVPEIDEEEVSKRIAEIAAIDGLLKRLTDFAGDVKEARSGIAEVDSQFNVLLEQMSEYKSCPTCGTALSNHEATHV